MASPCAACRFATCKFPNLKKNCLAPPLPNPGDAPVDSESIEINERQIKRKQKQVELYNQHAKDLPVLKPNDVVRVRKDDRWANKAQVLVQISPRSYKVLTKEGKL